MIDIVAYHGMKRLPFDKNLKSADALETGPSQECTARLDFIKRRGGVMLLTGDPGVGKTLALRKFRDGLNDNLFSPVYTPLSTLRGADHLRANREAHQHPGCLPNRGRRRRFKSVYFVAIIASVSYNICNYSASIVA